MDSIDIYRLTLVNYIKQVFFLYRCTSRGPPHRTNRRSRRLQAVANGADPNAREKEAQPMAIDGPGELENGNGKMAIDHGNISVNIYVYNYMYIYMNRNKCK